MSTSAAMGSSSGAVSEAIAKAEALLATFWSSSDAGGETVAKVRASTLNYVVICAPQDADAYREATERLSESHGGRTLLLTMSGRIAAWDLVPDIHAVCRLEGSVPICYDRIDLTFGAVAASRAASVVQALALPEISTVVEIGAGAPAPLIDNVAGKFNRLIVDSGKTSVSTIARILRHAPCAIADRAMIRTYAWRELTARFFDGAISSIYDIRRVEIARTPLASMGSSGGGQDPAPLFLGWLASRLGWKFKSREAAHNSQGRTVEIALIEEEREGVTAGQLTAMRLFTGEGDESLTCTIERPTAATSVSWRMRGTHTADREHALGFQDETWVAIKAIDSTEGDDVTRAALLSAAEWDACR